MKALLFANTDWYLFNFRLPLARLIREEGYETLLLSPNGPYVPKIKAEGFEWKEARLSRSGLNPLKELASLLQLIRIYRREKPDIVHHFTSKCVIFGSLAGKFSGVKHVVNAITGMGYVFTRKSMRNSLMQGLVHVLYQFSLKNSTVIFQNQEDLDYFVGNHLIDKEQVVLIPGSGVDTERFFPAPLPDGTPVVLLAARWLWDKGIHEFIQAARMVRGKNVNARFVLVGSPDEGNPSSIPTQKIEEWKQEGIVEFWGWREDMAAVYRGAWLVCLPSYREGLSKCLIEAAACGRALVASDIAGCREVVRDGINGYLVPKKDPEKLADAIMRIMDNKQLAQRMGQHSREIAEAEFSIEKINNATLSIYNNLID